MLDVFYNELRDKNYYICLFEDHLYIYNYDEIMCFNSDLIIIKLINNTVKIKGSKMVLKKMENKEILIKGIINGVTYEK